MDKKNNPVICSSTLLALQPVEVLPDTISLDAKRITSPHDNKFLFAARCLESTNITLSQVQDMEQNIDQADIILAHLLENRDRSGKDLGNQGLFLQLLELFSRVKSQAKNIDQDLAVNLEKNICLSAEQELNLSSFESWIQGAKGAVTHMKTNLIAVLKRFNQKMKNALIARAEDNPVGDNYACLPEMLPDLQ